MALAKQKVIVKKLSVLENLGSMNYLFTDKTGTMTENNLSIKELLDTGDLVPNLLLIVGGEYEHTPMDEVYDNAIEKYLVENKSFIKNEIKTKLDFSPFQVARGYSIYTFPDGNSIIRGQYKMVAQECRLTDNIFLDKCLSYEEQGLRVIAFGIKRKGEVDYTISGAVFFEDPLKSDAVSTYNKIEGLGVDVKMITGDSLAVASYIGRELEDNFDKNRVFSMDNYKQYSSLTEYEIYARCSPDNKSLIIDQHVPRGVVGFLGDGINDALALKRSDIGFVVNNASDVARQSSDVILIEKSLNPIARAIMLSRQAYFHIRTYLLCTLTGNIGTLVSLTLVVLFWQQIPMLPIQILLNNLLTDLPLMFLIADTIASSSLTSPIENNPTTFFKIIFIYALLSSIFDFVFFFMFYHYDITILRTGWFVFSVLAEIALVLSLRSQLSIFKAPHLSKILGYSLIICSLVAIVLPFTKFGELFSLYPLSLMQISLLLGIIGIYIIANEIVKKFVFKK